MVINKYVTIPENRYHYKNDVFSGFRDYFVLMIRILSVGIDRAGSLGRDDC